MLNKWIKAKSDRWYESQDCTIAPMIDYMISARKLRDAQIEAIKIYLYLKIVHGARPLYDLVTEGAFLSLDISNLELSDKTKNALREDAALAMLYELASQHDENYQFISRETVNLISKYPEKVNAKEFWKQFFYETDYTDYLFSLPMGSGKTFLMAAFIYLDLYFALNEPNNPAFAHNFIVLAPSGLKSSVVPSLKTIQRFDPSWVIPEPTASSLKRELKFELLDQQRSAKRSNKTKNPNVQKLALYQPFESLFGLVAVTNAEKVILDRITEAQGQLNFFEDSDDDLDRQANELRNLIGKIPSLSIFIDEVHHAATDEKKLRGVVNRWAKKETINSVISFTGTPYLAKKERFTVANNLKIGMSEITNVVFYYPLVKGIGNFLKKPMVRISTNRNRLHIVEDGLRIFFDRYIGTVYGDGCVAKIAIYCGLIASLEEEIYPVAEKVAREYGLDPNISILKFYRAGGGKGKKYKLPAENELAFQALDQPFSKVRIVLLAQIGKEGWDCRSLTGVILSQEGDCPTNMVLQTSCRCLRQTERNAQESALIVLNDGNAQLLNRQLAEQQKTDLHEFQKGGRSFLTPLKRYDRSNKLKLPRLSYYQMSVQYLAHDIEQEPDPRDKLSLVVDQSRNRDIIQWTQTFTGEESQKDVVTKEYGKRVANFLEFQNDIVRGSFGKLKFSNLKLYLDQIKDIYEQIIAVNENGIVVYSSFYDYEAVLSGIRKAFYPERDLIVKEELIKGDATLLDLTHFKEEFETEYPEKYIPNVEDTNKIILRDKGKLYVPDKIKKTAMLLRETANDAMADDLLNKYSVSGKVDRSYHYLPYRTDSQFEQKFLSDVLSYQVLDDLDLEVYYNGDEQFTEFRLRCYEKIGSQWNYLGRYTPDFIVLQRKNGQIHKTLIIETKGQLFAYDPKFIAKKLFVQKVFCPENNARFGYERFRYVYLEDTLDEITRISRTIEMMKDFFKEDATCL